ncbi:hypothetical protein H0X48_05395 [Candidatus Dependentiae bacterium]|nr:hypothetical protein [Candidatus Dependentiae bacterium]
MGNQNTAIGDQALGTNTSGNNNTALGENALSRLTTGDNHIALGVASGSRYTTENNNIAIANIGVVGESNTIRLGRQAIQADPTNGGNLPAHTAAFVAGIQTGVAPAANNTRRFVTVDTTTGQLFFVPIP